MRRSLLLALCCGSGLFVPVIAQARSAPPASAKAHAPTKAASQRKAEKKPERAVAARPSALAAHKPTQARRVTRKRPTPPVVKYDPRQDTAPRLVAHPDDPHEQHIAGLRQHLDELLSAAPLSRLRVGVTVVEAQSGDVLYAHNAERAYNPASNTKILTTAAALAALGGNWHWTTALHGPRPDAEGVIHGDVELRGSGDPLLTPKGLGELARGLRERGVTRIEGRLLADGKFRDADRPEVAAGEGALVLNRDAYTVRVSPTAIGDAAAVSIAPAVPEFFSIENHAVTSKHRTRLQLDVRRDDEGRYVVVVRGRINARRGTYSRHMHVADGASYAAVVLREALALFGIEVTGGVAHGGLRGDAPLLATHYSDPLADVCRVSNKPSDNFVADSIFKALGRVRYGGAATLEKGARAVLDTLKPFGINPGAVTLVNGSGLTYENRVRPAGIARLLRSVYLDLALAPEFISSLAIGGVDGTLRHRFRGDDMRRLVRGKTGTLSTVSALSGYVARNGRVLVFSILVNDFRPGHVAPIRVAQVQLVRAMMDYLREETTGVHEGEVKPGRAAPDADDGSEDGDEAESTTES